MEEKYVSVQGSKIFYLEKNPEANRCIFFLHGNSSSHHTWKFQFDSPLLSKYRLIAFDLPAHGFSDAASEITDGYSLPGLAGLIADIVLLLISGHPYMLVGVSLGTNIIAEMLVLQIKPAGILLAGPCILNEKYLTGGMIIPDTKIAVFFKDDLLEEDLGDMEDLAYRSRSEEKARLFKKDISQLKDRFRSRLFQTVLQGKYHDQVEAVRTTEVPVCIVFGKDDRAYFSNYLDNEGLPVWGNKIIKIQDAGHWVHQDEPEKFTELLSDFARDIF